MANVTLKPSGFGTPQIPTLPPGGAIAAAGDVYISADGTARLVAIYIQTSCNITVLDGYGASNVYTAFPANSYLPHGVTSVVSTTGTDVRVCY